jgi:hypothetical protein
VVCVSHSMRGKYAKALFKTPSPTILAVWRAMKVAKEESGVFIALCGPDSSKGQPQRTSSSIHFKQETLTIDLEICFALFGGTSAIPFVKIPRGLNPSKVPININALFRHIHCQLQWASGTCVCHDISFCAFELSRGAFIYLTVGQGTSYV